MNPHRDGIDFLLGIENRESSKTQSFRGLYVTA